MKRVLSMLAVASGATVVEHIFPGFITEVGELGTWAALGAVATNAVHRRQRTGSWT